MEVLLCLGIHTLRDETQATHKTTTCVPMTGVSMAGLVQALHYEICFHRWHQDVLLPMFCFSYVVIMLYEFGGISLKDGRQGTQGEILSSAALRGMEM